MTTWLSVVVRRMEGRSVTTSPTPLASKPSNPWIQFYKASLPTYKERFPSLKNSEIMKKVAEEWKMMSKEEKAKITMMYREENEKWKSTVEVSEVGLACKEKGRGKKKGVTEVIDAALVLPTSGAATACMMDPIQELFLASTRAYTSSGGLGAAAQVELAAELAKVARQFGIAEDEDATAFPTLTFVDKDVDPIDVSQ